MSKVSTRCDHRGVIRAQLHLGEKDLKIFLREQALAQPRIRCNPAYDNDSPRMELSRRSQHLLDQDVYDGFLERRRDVGLVGVGVIAQIVDDSRLQPGKAELQRVRIEHRARERQGFRISLTSEFIERCSSGIAQAQKLSDFIERFTGGVVARLAQDFVLPVGTHFC
jgi:hypothetical protein